MKSLYIKVVNSKKRMDAFAPISVSFVLNKIHWELVCNSQGVINVKQNGNPYKYSTYHVEKFFMKNGVIPSYSPSEIQPDVLYSMFQKETIIVNERSRVQVLDKMNASKCDSSKHEQMKIRDLFGDLLELPIFHKKKLQIQFILFSGPENNLDITIYSLEFIF